jgi:tetratricopeptide (TPR) repeat protein
MRVSNVAILTLAALASQNVTAKTSANPAPPPAADQIPQASNFVDAINNTESRSSESISAPEMIASEQFSPRVSAKSQKSLLVAAARPELSAAVKTKANDSASLGDEFTKSLQETWLAKVIESGVETSPQVRDALAFFSPRAGGNAESGYDLNNTTTLLNVLLILATLFPPVTIAFFWFIRGVIVKQLVADANKRLQGIGVLESELKNSSQLTQRLRSELETQMLAAKQSVEFLSRESEVSKTSIEQIETLKSQFLLHLQVLLTEVQEKKSQIVEEISQVPAVVAKEAVKFIPQPQLNNSPQSQVESATSDGENLMIDDYIKQGEALYAKGNYAEAVVCFEKAILTNNSANKAWFWRGNVLIKLQRAEEAIDCYDQAISLESEQYEVWYKKASLLGKLQRYKEAIVCYERASSIGPNSFDPWHNIAALLGKLQHYEEAVAAYDRALAIKDTDSEIWHNRGAMLGKLQDYAEAVDSYDRALTINPNRYETWYNRGNMLWKLLRYADAVVSYDRAIEIQPEKYEVWYNKGAVLGRMHRYQEAIESYDKALAIKSNDFELWHNRGVAYDKLSQHSEAIASFEQAIMLMPDCYEAWFGKGESLAKMQQPEAAIVAYEEAIAIKPESYDAWRHLGTVLSELKRYEEAMAAYDRAIAIKPENAEAWRARGALASELKQDTGDIESGEKPTEVKPNSEESSDLLTGSVSNSGSSSADLLTGSDTTVDRSTSAASI